MQSPGHSRNVVVLSLVEDGGCSSPRISRSSFLRSFLQQCLEVSVNTGKATAFFVSLFPEPEDNLHAH